MSEEQERNQRIIDEFRANDGKVGGYFENTPLLLLHTIGAKSGVERINPAAYIMDGDRFVIIASKAGASTNPNWYHNLVANPQVTVEVGAEKFQALAAPAEERERTQLYEKMIAATPGFAGYLDKTTRVIPVIIISRKP